MEREKKKILDGLIHIDWSHFQRTCCVPLIFDLVGLFSSKIGGRLVKVYRTMYGERLLYSYSRVWRILEDLHVSHTIHSSSAGKVHCHSLRTRARASIGVLLSPTIHQQVHPSWTSSTGRRTGNLRFDPCNART